MIDQDYAELLSRTPPSGEVLEWTFSTRSVASAFAALLLGTPALCTALYSSGLSGSSDPREGAELRVPTMTRLGMQSPTGEIFTAGMHLAAVAALLLFWCVRLAHHQRLQARTGVPRYDLEADEAARWVTAAWVMGAFGAVFLFAGASVSGDENASFSAQGIAHLALFVGSGVGMLGQAICTAWALRKARRVFIVSDADLTAYRRKTRLAVIMLLAAAAAIASVLLLERFVDNAWTHHSPTTLDTSDRSNLLGQNSISPSTTAAGSLEVLSADLVVEASVAGFNGDVDGVAEGGGGGRDCDEEWCYSRSALGLWEWVFFLLEAGFCLALRHDLAPATGGVGVESFVL